MISARASLLRMINWAGVQLKLAHVQDVCLGKDPLCSLGPAAWLYVPNARPSDFQAGTGATWLRWIRGRWQWGTYQGLEFVAWAPESVHILAFDVGQAFFWAEPTKSASILRGYLR